MHNLNMSLKKWVTCVLGLTAIAAQNVRAATLDYSDDISHDYKRAPPCEGPSCAPRPLGSTFTPVIGVPVKIVERRPIGVLQTNYPDVFNMFVLALQGLQARNESVDISFYQVAGKIVSVPVLDCLT